MARLRLVFGRAWTGAVMLVLRAIFAAATIAVIGIAGYYLIDRKEATRTAAVEPADPDLEALRDTRKKARAASKLAIKEGCTALSADYEVWDDYLDKKTRRKLEALIAKCNSEGEGEAQVSADP